MSRREAMREARRLFGDPTFPRERRLRTGLLFWLESVFADLHYATRMLRRSPGFATVAILSLGLGIGANTAIFSLYNALVVRPLPVPHPEELVQVTFGGGRTDFSNPLWEELRDQQDALSGAFAVGSRSFNLTDGGEVKSVPGYWVSGDFFTVLGVQPVLGRLLTNNDDLRGCPAVAVVSYGLWQREYAGAADMVGRTLMLDGAPFEVIGVVDPAFSGVDVGVVKEVYAPICALPIVDPGSEMLDARGSSFLAVLGRPARGLTVEQASARLAAQAPGIFDVTVSERWDAERQRTYRALTFSLRPAPAGLSALRNQYRGALLVVMALVGVVLLIACANVANLLLARATRRQHEMSIRRAIGAGRGRLVRLLVTESLLLSLLGGIIGVVFSGWASTGLVGMLSTSQDVWLDLDLDFRILGFTTVVAAGTGVLFGLAPAWWGTRAAPQTALQTAGQKGAHGHARFAAGRALVIAQLAMSFSLVVGAGLLIGTLTQLLTLDTGFTREGILLVTVDHRYDDRSPAESHAVDQQVLQRIRGLPGVGSASAAWITPIDGTLWNTFVEVDGYSPADRWETLAYLNSTSGAYFTTLGIPLLAGRDFDSRDTPGTTRVAIINETMANRFFSESRPLGRVFRLRRHERAEAFEVIGVVADTKYQSIDEESLAIAYFPLTQTPPPDGTLQYQLRTGSAPTALVPAVVDLMKVVDPRISFRFSTLEAQVGASLARPRILAVLAGSFGAVALLLAMVGLYGTFSYRVASRRYEIAVRLAVGAAQTSVLGMVLGEVGRLVFVGIGIGIVIAVASTRFLSSFLFGLTATDPKTFVLCAVVLATVSMAAGGIPAWHAARLNPMKTLRRE